jgi:hypothetical protein
MLENIVVFVAMSLLPMYHLCGGQIHGARSGWDDQGEGCYFSFPHCERCVIPNGNSGCGFSGHGAERRYRVRYYLVHWYILLVQILFQNLSSIQGRE